MKTKRLYPYLIALIVALGGFLLGFDGVVNSGAIPFYKNTFGISNQPFLVGISAGAIILGAIFGNLIAGPASDRLGRKKSLLITSVLFMIGAGGTAIAPDIWIFICSKFIAGLGVGMAILIAPIYIAEIAPPALRGKLVTFNQLNIVIGLSVAYFSNYFFLQQIPDPNLNWRWMLGVGFFPALAYFLLLFLIPESPRWLAMRGLNEKALTILQNIGGADHASTEMKNITQNLNRKTEKAGIREVFSTRMKYVLFIGFALAFFQQASGINAVLYYAPMIFESAGGGRDAAFLQAIVVGLVFTGMTILSMFLIDKLGRRPLLIIGSSIMGLFLLVVGISFYAASYSLTAEAVSSIESSIYEQELIAEATQRNPRAYQYDSMQVKPEKAVLYNKTVMLLEMDLRDPSIKSLSNDLSKLVLALHEMQDQKFQHEVRFFNEIQRKLVEGAPNQEELRNKFSAIYKPVIRDNSISINSVAVLIGILGFIAGFSISLGPVMWTMLSEIFPNSLRGLSISIVGALNALTSFVVATVFPAELEYLGSANTFIIFSVFMVLCLLFCIRYIPETKGKTLEEIENELITVNED